MMHGVTEKPGKWLAPEPSGVVADVTEPNFSVLIPAYQAARTIGEAVESALTQTVQPQEIIVCDDGSTDDLSGALEPYRDRITVVRLEQNQGLSAARNAALMAASSEFVATLDADDTYLPRYLEAIAELASARPDLAILVTDAYVELDGKRLRRSYDESWAFEVANQRLGILERNFIPSRAVVRRSTLLDLGGWDESLRHAEDWDLWLRMIFRGLSAGLVCEPLACYRVHPDSLSTDRVALRRSELLVLQRAASSDLPMTTSERLALERSLARHQRQSRLEDLRAALARDAPEVRRLARGVASEPGYPVPTRLKAAAAAAIPGLLGRLQRRQQRARWIGAAHVRVERD